MQMKTKGAIFHMTRRVNEGWWNECWWRLIVFISVELLFVTLVTYGWPEGDWKLDWGAVGALATTVTGAAAVYIAYLQSEIRKKEKIEKIIKNNKEIEIKFKELTKKIYQIYLNYGVFKGFVSDDKKYILASSILKFKSDFIESCNISEFDLSGEGLSEGDVFSLISANEKIRFLRDNFKKKLEVDDFKFVDLFFNNVYEFMSLAVNMVDDCLKVGCLSDVESELFFHESNFVYKEKIKEIYCTAILWGRVDKIFLKSKPVVRFRRCLRSVSPSVRR